MLWHIQKPKKAQKKIDAFQSKEGFTKVHTQSWFGLPALLRIALRLNQTDELRIHRPCKSQALYKVLVPIQPLASLQELVFPPSKEATFFRQLCVFSSFLQVFS